MYEDEYGNSEFVDSYDDIYNTYTYDDPEYVGSYDDIYDAYAYENPEFVTSYDAISDAYTYDNPESVSSYDDISTAYTYDNPEFVGSYNNIPVAGDTVPKTDYIASLVAAVKSGTLSSDDIKKLPSSVQTALTKSLTAPSFLDKVGDFLGTTTGKAIGIGGLAALLQSMGNRGVGDIYKGYQGGIPNLSASRTMNAIPTTSVDAAGKTVARRPGQGGITYFSPMQYTPVPKPVTPAAATPAVSELVTPAAATDTVEKAMGGIAGYAMGGLGSLGGYSDGGRLLRGPGDGVSDSIPATIGQKQPARLADGEFVVPARVVSEIGNGSTEAGARKLYAMMDRVQKARRKTLKNVAANSRADKYLPA